MGLEPTTFCMASARDVRTRSRAFAQSVLFAGSSFERANATERERTPNLAILATPRSAPRRFRRGGACYFPIAAPNAMMKPAPVPIRKQARSRGEAARSSSSDTNHGAAATGTPPSLTTDADGLRCQTRGPFNWRRVLALVTRPHTTRWPTQTCPRRTTVVIV